MDTGHGEAKATTQQEVAGEIHRHRWQEAQHRHLRHQEAQEAIAAAITDMRVSTAQQSYERQYAALQAEGIPDQRIFEDKKSGKTMNRDGFRELSRITLDAATQSS